jgi:ribosome-binding protein aMBF1 (putative translation factor)
LRPAYQGVNYRILYFFGGKSARMEGVIMTAKKKEGLDQLIDKFVGDDPERQTMLDEEVVNVEAAQLVYDLRTKAGLSQRELAKKVGTTASVICRMEQADYEGSLPMLRRIAGALDRRLELRAVPIKPRITRRAR